MTSNPFKPTAGKMPPVLLGRGDIIADFRESLSNGAGAPGRLMLITGQRGYGKTVMLTELRRIAEENEWITVSETASDGLASRLINALAPRGWRMESATLSPSIGIPGVASASLGNASVHYEDTAALTLRNAINDCLRNRKVKRGKGILFTIDETQAASRDDLVAIATAVQHVISDQDLFDIPDPEKKGIAFAFAGLPSLVDELVNDKVLTFLRRALRRDLGDVPILDVKNAYVKTFGESGKELGEELAWECAKATSGYPYMIQLVGYYVWQSAERDGRNSIDERDLAVGTDDALIAFGDAVCAPAFDALGASARKFAIAMSQMGDEDVRVTDVAEHAGKSRSWASKYRDILIAEKVVVPTEFGFVRFAVPHMARFVRERRS